MNNSTIKNLFYGNISPIDMYLKSNHIKSKTNKQLIKELEFLENKLGSNNYHFNRYNHLLHLHFESLYFTYFEEGLSLGMKLAFETLNHK